MRRILFLIAFAAINASPNPAVAADCTSMKNIDPSRSFCEPLRSQPAKAAEKEKLCRASASFHESMMLRRVAASRVDGTGLLAVLDTVITAFNDLRATKCSG